MTLFTVRRFVFAVIGQIIVAASITYLAPALSLVLKSCGLVPSIIGLYFSLPSIVYVIFGIITPKITEWLPKRLVIAFGFHICAFAVFIIG